MRILSAAIASVLSFTISLWLKNRRKSPLIHQALSGSNTSVFASHWLTLPTAIAHSHAQTEAYTYAYTCKRAHTLPHAFVPLILTHSILPSLHLSLSDSALHANERSVLMLEHYCYVCLISMLPFLSSGDYPFFYGTGLPFFILLLSKPASQLVT